jgi:hypothetical protein
MFKEMMKRKRRAYALNACITDKVYITNKTRKNKEKVKKNYKIIQIKEED